MSNYEIKKLSLDSLCESLSNDELSDGELKNYKKVEYIFEYLKELETDTIVVEKNYVDGGYLEDYSEYYSKCFKDYDRKCKRLHCFSCNVEEEIFESFISGEIEDMEEESIRRSYCGFIVARPLPERVIGRTALRTYPPDGGRRKYHAVTDVHANLFGADLSVSSLPFQEQDNVLAACATVSLWSALQKTADLFNSRAPRPAVITKTANQVVDRYRPVPSEGLDLRQISHAIRSVDLMPEVFDVREVTPLISLMYAYLQFGLPVMLTAEVSGELHAVTVVGYSKRESRVQSREVSTNVSSSLPVMEGLWIDELYAHDDGIGPFSRLNIVSGTTDYPVKFESDWPDSLSPHAVIIPVYDKIRVTFLDIQEWLVKLAPITNIPFPQTESRVRWNVHLTTVNSLKSEIREKNSSERKLDINKAKNILKESQPRYIWRIEANHEKEKLFEILVDATDMRTSFPAYKIISYKTRFTEELGRIVREEEMQSTLEDILGIRVLRFMREEM